MSRTLSSERSNLRRDPEAEERGGEEPAPPPPAALDDLAGTFREAYGPVDCD
jgi:hypothetical protein